MRPALRWLSLLPIAACGATFGSPRPAQAGEAEACIAASDEMWGRFNDRYTGPLVSWSSDLTKHAAAEAACSLLLTRGINPALSEYEILKDLRDQARSWADKVGACKVSPTGIVDATPTTNEAGPVLYTRTIRGW